MASNFKVLHHVLPGLVYAKYYKLIDQITKGDFDQNAMYNLVFLYVDAEEALKEGTVMYGTDVAPLIKSYSNMMDKIAAEANPVEQDKMFKGAHSYFRSALHLNECKNPTYLNMNDLHYRSRKQ